MSESKFILVLEIQIEGIANKNQVRDFIIEKGKELKVAGKMKKGSWSIRELVIPPEASVESGEI